MAATGNGTELVEVEWQSGQTVTELTAKADVVVHGVVLAVHPSRAVTRPLPPGQRAAPGYKVIVHPYTDSTLKVLDFYKGSVGAQIRVTQWGGKLAATDQYPAIERFAVDLPQFRVQGEYVLFLMRLPANDPSAGGQETNALINPAARYEVLGPVVCRPGDMTPPTLTDLVTWIQHGEPPTPTSWPQTNPPPTAVPPPTAGPAYPQP